MVDALWNLQGSPFHFAGLSALNGIPTDGGRKKPPFAKTVFLFYGICFYPFEDAPKDNIQKMSDGIWYSPQLFTSVIAMQEKIQAMS